MSTFIFNIREAAKQPPKLLSGHRLCAGCAEAIIVKQVLLATRGPTIVATATGCLEVSTSIYPYTSWNIPWIHVAFENVAAVASGIEAAVKALSEKGLLKYEHVDVIAFAGDGGTYDIGLQALSGAIERNHDFLYVLLDNEAYMNTGIQRSGGTPLGASTTTTPAGKAIPGKTENKKPIADIVIAHRAPYVATATPAHFIDLIRKTRKAIEVRGPTFIHTLSPCPRGWRHGESITIELCKKAVDTCYFPLWEYENGAYKLTDRSLAIAKNPNLKKPIEEFLKVQGRFSHLFTPENQILIKRLQEYVDEVWESLKERCENI
ncbi:MAG: thiamine pyrophosphate-dependent enzyme [Candidatus Methanomethylicia archaeon]|nr:thiamine pyrophosphate-dependent enzyme [Candidatus Methanomethylicia archaeon]MCX8169278.1 thiamine pyrophosphate-dependent enzyme [Candidatus Methanomethylicia archaeon]MDW7988940.1 thiamine pyrophosphate-dependent enzyme [Nitrososphaerota archaeon]